jgi:hypothetical protein
MMISGMMMYDMSRPNVIVTNPTPPIVMNVAPQTVQYWYWCAGANAYFPYVQTCPNGWQAVPATPPAP